MRVHLAKQQKSEILRVANKDGILLVMKKYWTGSHTKHRLMYHIIWIPKYRKRILKGMLADRIKELLIQCADVNNWQIQEINVQVDHIHAIVQLDTKTSVARAIQLFKGGSSKKIREEFPELEEFLWGDSLWSDGYFAETVGSCDEEVIKKYVQNQK
jgi:putative transposase